MLRLRRHLFDGASGTFGRMVKEKNQQSGKHTIPNSGRYRCRLPDAHRRRLTPTTKASTSRAYRRSSQSPLVEEKMLSGSEKYYDDIYNSMGKDYVAET